MKKILFITLIFVLICFSACTVANVNENTNYNTDTSDATEATVDIGETTTESANYNTDVSDVTESIEDYTIQGENCYLICQEGICYLKLDESYVNSHQGDNNCEEVPHIDFIDIDSFVGAFKNVDFTEEQLNMISKFPIKNNQIEIFNVNNIYYPTVSGKQANISIITWSEGIAYYYDFEYNGLIVSANIIDSEKYENAVNKEPEFLKTADILSDTILEDGKRVIEYCTILSENIKYEKYTLSDDNQTVTVIKKYRSDEKGYSVPYYVEIYGKRGEICYTMIMCPKDNDLSDEVLMSFSMQKYIENDHEVM